MHPVRAGELVQQDGETTAEEMLKLNQAEAFETFLQTKYVGQKRFSLEGGESLIPMLDVILAGAALIGPGRAGSGSARNRARSPPSCRPAA